MEAPRSSLQALTFYPNGFSVIYEGPSNADGWKLDRNGRGWQYRDGAFVTSSVGILGRDLQLSGPCNFEFDLAWSGHFSLSFILYAEMVDRFDYSQNCYMFHLAPGYLNVQRVQAGVGVTSLGQAQIPEMLRKGKMRLQIRTTKDEPSLGVWVDGVLIQKWRDHSGFVTKGSGVVFSSQIDGPQIRVSNMKVTGSDASMDAPSPVEQRAEDLILLANRDRMNGNIVGIRDGKLIVAAFEKQLEVPLTRVTQVYLAKPEDQGTSPKPWEIRVDVAGGGRVSFELDKWSSSQISGRSKNFGLVALNLDSIRQIQFNANRATDTGGSLENGAPGKWEFDE
jgi:hypothetical protein